MKEGYFVIGILARLGFWISRFLNHLKKIVYLKNKSNHLGLITFGQHESYDKILDRLRNVSERLVEIVLVFFFSNFIYFYNLSYDENYSFSILVLPHEKLNN